MLKPLLDLEYRVGRNPQFFGGVTDFVHAIRHQPKNPVLISFLNRLPGPEGRTFGVGVQFGLEVGHGIPEATPALGESDDEPRALRRVVISDALSGRV